MRTAALWWGVQNSSLAKQTTYPLRSKARNLSFTRSLAEKYRYADFAELLLRVSEDKAVIALNNAAQLHGISANRLAKLIMDGDTLKKLNQTRSAI